MAIVIKIFVDVVTVRMNFNNRTCDRNKRMCYGNSSVPVVTVLDVIVIVAGVTVMVLRLVIVSMS